MINNGNDDDESLTDEDDDDDAEFLEDQAELQAILASRININNSEEASATDSFDQHNNNSTTTTTANDDVLYSLGATKVFTACEETRWKDVLECIETEPKTISTFIKSTGTANTTFGWSLWRRLPIHEACRRQAPAWVIAALIRAAPDTVKATTQFRELPLHLAVEMGASPEVINLLIVSYWESVLEKDNSGRIPLEFLDKSEGMTQSDFSVIHDCLKRSTNALKKIKQEWDTKYKDLQNTHKAILNDTKTQHSQRMAKEKEKHQILAESYDKVKGHVRVFQDERVQLEQELALHSSEKEEWQRELESRDETIQQLHSQVSTLEQGKAKLETKIMEQEGIVLSLQSRIQQLENDLVNITHFQTSTVMTSLTLAQKNLNAMMDANHALQGTLIGQSKGLTMLLNQRGIYLPPPPPPPKPKQDPMVHDIDVTEVGNTAAMSALKALQLESNRETVHQDQDDEECIPHQHLD